MWVGLSINWLYPVVEFNDSNSLPVFEHASSTHQFVNLALKSPITIEQNGQ